ITPPTPLNSSVAPMRSGATACTLRAKKFLRSSFAIRRVHGGGSAGLACGMRIFLAGASGAIGRRMMPLLLGAGHVVTGSTRTAERGAELARAGVIPAVLDVFDAQALSAAVRAAQPEVIIHQLTDLPREFDEARLVASYPKNARIRTEGTRNLIAAA